MPCSSTPWLGCFELHAAGPMMLKRPPKSLWCVLETHHRHFEQKKLTRLARGISTSHQNKQQETRCSALKPQLDPAQNMPSFHKQREIFEPAAACHVGPAALLRVEPFRIFGLPSIQMGAAVLQNQATLQ